MYSRELPVAQDRSDKRLCSTRYRIFLPCPAPPVSGTHRTDIPRNRRQGSGRSRPARARRRSTPRAWACPRRNSRAKSSAGRRCARALRRRSEEHTSELQSQSNLVCRLLLEKKKKTKKETSARIQT